MKLKEASFDVTPEGTYNAVLREVLNMGLQETMFGDKEKVRLVWEIEMPEGRESIGQEYTPSASVKSNIVKDIQAMGFKLDQLTESLKPLLGAGCWLQVVHNEAKDGSRVYANVGGLVPLGASADVLKPEGDFLYLETMEEYRANADKVPEWLADRAMTGLARQEEKERLERLAAENKAQREKQAQSALEEDEIPFGV